MTKNAEATKSRMKPKLMRTPLRDVSNVKTATKSVIFSKTVSENDGGPAGEDSLDRLLLVHSDLSSLVQQIDELVVQALQLKSNKGMKEIKQFADVLTDMQTSLKPWVPRFRAALLSQSARRENRSEQPIGSTKAVTESPEETKQESLISPSPLVSWRAECNTEGGRQLFLLTPLPRRKAFPSKCQVPSLPSFENITSNEIIHLPEGDVSAKPTPSRALNIEVTKVANNLRIDCASPEKSSTMNCSLFVMTPCLKTSPPKSCMLLEPVSEFSKKKNWKAPKCTPFPTRVQSCNLSEDTKSSSGQSSGDMKHKYPELYGIEMVNLQKRTVAEDSPDWIISPPKTCIILEPSDETLLGNQQDDHLPTKRTDVIGVAGLAECTPMMKETTSSFRMGKHPGENTLKKELWIKFEEASTTHSICFNRLLLQTTTKKGFLDQLDEVFNSDA